MRRKHGWKGDLGTLQKPAPGDLSIVHAFVNTSDARRRTEELTDPRALAGWLAGQGLAVARALDESDLRQALEVREGLRELLAAKCGLAFDGKAVRRLDEAAVRARYRARLDDDGTVRFELVADGFDAFLGRLFQSLHAAQTDGTWRRFKLCANRACRAAFYDHSNNAMGKWCSGRRCGNQLASARYRRREKYRIG